MEISQHRQNPTVQVEKQGLEVARRGGYSANSTSGVSMTTNKTTVTGASVTEFIRNLDSSQRRNDSKVIMRMMRKITGHRPVMWGDSLIGYGKYHYVYESGREGDAFLTGFSPRTQNMVIYIMPGFKPYSGLLKKLGKHKNSVSCLYFNKLADLNCQVLEQLIEKSVVEMRKRYQ